MQKAKTIRVTPGFRRLIPFSFFLLPFALLLGCARFATTQTDYSYEQGQIVRQVRTKATAHTFFAARSSLANWKASQTDKTQGASVGQLDQQASAIDTNTVALVHAVIDAAVRAAVASAKP